MSAPPAAQPIYLQLAPDPVFGLLHRPHDRASATGVLLCAPWGWEEVASYRSRRIWAQHLAQAGHLTLRFDFPGSGDSAGLPGDPGRLDAWSGAISAAADWLRATGGCGRVAAVGLGLSGLVACKAIAEGAGIDDLVLWAAPSRGRAFLRAQRAFSALQTSRHALTGGALPDGWMEVGGFVLSAETIGALERLDARELTPGALRRALLLDRDGVGVDQNLRSRLEEAGVAIAVGAGTGWEAMVDHPERPEPPLEVFDQVASWLAQAPAPVGAVDPAPAPAASANVVLDVDGVRISETPLVLERASGLIFGVLAQRADASSAPLCAVFVNAGALRRIGANRMWTEASRRWAARGVPAVRIDLEGLGDADGDGSRYRDVKEFYVHEELVDQVLEVLDELQAREVGRRFVLIGLCSGGYLAFHAATRHARVGAALLVNAGALVWDSDLLVRRAAHKLDRLRRLAWWKRILQGKVKLANVRAVIGALAISALRVARRIGERAPEDARAGLAVDSVLDRLDGDTRVVLAFSGDEPFHAELERDGVLARLPRWPNIALESLPGRDHTLRHVVAQRAVGDLVDREIERELRRAGDT